MASYELVRIGVYDTLIFSTSPSVLQWAENELRQHLPHAKFGWSGSYQYHCVDSYPHEAREVFWQLLRQLLEQGWEPFAGDQGTCWLRRQS